MMGFSPDVQSLQLASQHWAFQKLFQELVFKPLLETNKGLNSCTFSAAGIAVQVGNSELPQSQ